MPVGSRALRTALSWPDTRDRHLLAVAGTPAGSDGRASRDLERGFMQLHDGHAGRASTRSTKSSPRVNLQWHPRDEGAVREAPGNDRCSGCCGHRAGGHLTTQGGARTALFARHYCVCGRAMFIATRRASSFARYDWGLAPCEDRPGYLRLVFITDLLQTTVPNKAPTPAVSPMASAPQNVTRIAPTARPAPPTPAANVPKSARNSSEVPGTAELDFSPGRRYWSEEALRLQWRS